MTQLVKIKSIKKIKSDSKRYDIQTEKTSNFFANNILVHNSSCTVYIKDGQVGVCSRNWELHDSGNKFWDTIKAIGLDTKLLNIHNELGLNIALQGELIGEGIQGNKYNLVGTDIYFFNVFDIDTGKYYDYKHFRNFCENNGIKTVPILDDNFILNYTVKKLVELSKGKSVLNDKAIREGIVIRPLMEVEGVRGLGRLSFKVINPDFLLKNNE